MVKFMHISDTHLGSVQYSIPEREEDFYDVFREAMEIAKESEVDFIIHSGDLFDSPRPSNRALRIAQEEMHDLEKRNIPVYSIVGDHDRPKLRDNPSHVLFDLFGMKMLGLDEFQSTLFKGSSEPVFIGGIGNLKSFRSDFLKEQYNRASLLAKDYKTSIFISHQAIAPLFPTENSEANEDDLPVNFNYLAFGHVHQFKQKKYGRSLFAYS